MSRAALVSLLVWPAAAASQTPASPDAVRPRSESVYAADDPQGDLKLRVEALTGLYLLNPPQRHASERVVIDGERLQLSYWQVLGASTESELKTRAVQWFVLGRTRYATGARGVFGELGAIDEVTLVFHEVVRPEKSRRRREPETIEPYLMLRLRRARFERLDLRAIEACGEAGDCSVEFEALFDDARFDRRYYRQRRAALEGEAP